MIRAKRTAARLAARKRLYSIEKLEPRNLLALIISEIVAENVAGIVDSDGDHSDWIEIHNPSAEGVDLNGWSLTDEVEVPDKWQFPAVTLEPGDSLLLFASGKDRVDPNLELHTNFDLDIAGEYLGLLYPDDVVSFEFGPSFPQQQADVSYGVEFEKVSLVDTNSDVDILVPTSSDSLIAERLSHFAGVNLAGAEFGGTLPGTHGTNYIYPNRDEIDYFLDQGMNTFRLPFRWERLQHSLFAEFDSAELVRLTNFVDYATSQGGSVVLDPHNYARYYGDIIGTPNVPRSAFADFWSRLATEFRDNPRVIYGLVNEPYGLDATDWVLSVNEAIAAIRDVGAEQLILVPGVAWTGAGSWSSTWYGTPNAVAMLNTFDPLDNFAFDMHQYLDDGSGTSPNVVSETIGSERIAGVTNWLRQHGHQAFLGEFGIGQNTPALNALDDMMQFINANADVWIGWTIWSAGPWWGDYFFSVEPDQNGDKPQIAVLQNNYIYSDTPDPWYSPDYAPRDWAAESYPQGFGVSLQPNTEPAFTVRMVDINGGNDGTFGDLNEARNVLDGNFSPADYIVVDDITVNLPMINFAGDTATFPQDLPYPDGRNDRSNDQFALRVQAEVTIPAGDWTIGFGSDDGGAVRLQDVAFISASGATGFTPGDNEVSHIGGGAHAWRTGRFTVPAGGLTTSLKADFFEGRFGDSFELAIRPGHHSNSVSPSTWDLLADGVLGWSVTTATLPTFLDLNFDNVATAALFRTEFQVEDGSFPGSLNLGITYNDGFVAYLNGVEVARRNAPAQLDWDSIAPVPRTVGDSRIEEMIDLESFRSLLQPGSNLLAIHGLNNVADDGTFLIEPTLTADRWLPEIPGAFVLPTPATANSTAISDPFAPTVSSIGGNQNFTDPADLPQRDQPTSWSQQRSDLRNIVVDFSEPVTATASDIRLSNLGLDGESQPLVISLTDGQFTWEGNQLTIAFAAYSLPDGVFQLEVLDSVVDRSGNALVSVVEVGSPNNGLYMLRSDWNGDNDISVFDFSTFSYWFGYAVGIAPEYVDTNVDAGISVFDFTIFSRNFGTGIAFPNGLSGAGVSDLVPIGLGNSPQT
ncbi:MAG: endoglucanase, partial [Pirellulaceae bacterium]